MRVQGWRIWGASAVLVMLSTGAARAESSVEYGQMQRRLAELEQQVAQMQPRVQGKLTSYGEAEAAGEVDAGCCAPCAPCGPRLLVGQDFWNAQCRGGGVVFGGELSFLKPVATNGALPGQRINYGGLQDINVTNQFQFETTPRFWLGYVTGSGLGFRVRYWEFDHTTIGTLGNGIDTLTGRIEFRTLDWEVTQQVEFRRWRMLFFGGFRYAETNQSERFDFFPFGPALDLSFRNHTGFDGIGLTGGMNLNRSLFNTERLRWYTDLRGSTLFGNRKYNYDFAINNFQQDVNITMHDDFLAILELGTGPQWQMPLANGGQFFVRGGFEGQVWLNSGTVSNFPFDSSLGNIGFGGFAVSTGIVR